MYCIRLYFVARCFNFLVFSFLVLEKSMLKSPPMIKSALSRFGRHFNRLSRYSTAFTQLPFGGLYVEIKYRGLVCGRFMEIVIISISLHDLLKVSPVMNI